MVTGLAEPLRSPFQPVNADPGHGNRRFEIAGKIYIRDRPVVDVAHLIKAASRRDGYTEILRQGHEIVFRVDVIHHPIPTVVRARLLFADAKVEHRYLVIWVIGQTADYMGTGTTNVRLNAVLGRGTPVEVAREVDVKMDDGQPLTGSMRIAIDSGATFGTVGQSDDQTACQIQSSNTYNIQASSQDCNLVYIF